MTGPIDWQKWAVRVVLLAAAAAGALYLLGLERPTTTVAVPREALPVFHLIEASDLTTRVVATGALPAGALLQDTDLIGRYTTESAAARQPLSASQVVSAAGGDALTDTLPLAIPATPAMVFDGRLAGGTAVTLWRIDSAGAVADPPLLPGALVLDVQRIAGAGEHEADAYTYLVTVAVPRQSAREVVELIAGGSYWLTPQLQ